jgi:hypothetical protein
MAKLAAGLVAAEHRAVARLGWWRPGGRGEQSPRDGGACSLGLSATSQQYFSLRTNQSSATSQQYLSLRTNQHQPSATSQTKRLLACPLHARTSFAEPTRPWARATWPWSCNAPHLARLHVSGLCTHVPSRAARQPHIRATNRTAKPSQTHRCTSLIKHTHTHTIY